MRDVFFPGRKHRLTSRKRKVHVKGSGVCSFWRIGREREREKRVVCLVSYSFSTPSLFCCWNFIWVSIHPHRSASLPPRFKAKINIQVSRLMTSRTMRRRLHHGDVDGKKHEHLIAADLDDLNEPLLGNNDDYNATQSEVHMLEDILYDEGRKQRLHWTLLFSHLISEWAQWLAKFLLGSGTYIARLLTFPSMTESGPTKKFLPPLLSPLQEARLRTLQQRLEVPFDGSCLEHQDALKQLWRAAYPNRELPGLKSELWKEMGWQGPDPSTDFRGGGFISLENLIFFARTYPEAFQNLLHKNEGNRAQWEYPFAVAGINISFMLVQMLDIQSGMPTSVSGVRFLEFLSNDESAFDELYCVAFRLMDAHWLAKRASYMEFNEVLKSTRMQLERELALEDVTCVKDLPAYNMLRR